MIKKWYSAENFGGRISLGKADEGEAVRLEIDVKEWVAAYPDAQIRLFVTPPKPLTPYFAEIEGPTEGVVTWTLSRADTQYAGNGTLELLLIQGEKKQIKSATACTTISSSPSANTPAGDAPQQHPAWWENAVKRIDKAEEEALNSVETARAGAVGAVEGKFDEEVAAGKAAVEAAGAAQTQAVNQAGAVQQSAIENKAANALASIPEDYTTLANDVSHLKDQTAKLQESLYTKNLFNVKTVTRGKSINASNSLYDAYGYTLSDFIPVESGRALYFSVDGTSVVCNFVHQYNSSGVLISNKLYAENPYIVPDNVAFIRVTTQDSKINTAAFQIEYDEVTGYVEYGNMAKMAYEMAMTLSGESDNPLATIRDDPGLLSCFLNVGCIGDSLASGVAVYKDADGNVVVNSQNRYPYSWGQFLARMTGNKYYNWSSGGLRTDTWLSSSYATECFDGQHLCQAYIIGLAQNDNNASKEVGTSADIDAADYNNNADTFYGRYAKIIQRIKEVQPKAKIFVITDPLEAVETAGYNTAIRYMATAFDNVYVMDMYAHWASAPCAEHLANNRRYGHYNAVGYYIIAKMMMTYIDWIMRNQWEDFREVENIGTEWYYYD